MCIVKRRIGCIQALEVAFSEKGAKKICVSADKQLAKRDSVQQHLPARQPGEGLC